MDEDQDISSVHINLFRSKAPTFQYILGSTLDASQSYILFHLSDAL